MAWRSCSRGAGCANYAQQIARRALAGRNLALARTPLVAQSLAHPGDLVEVLPGHRLDSPLAHWLVVGPRSSQRPERSRTFCAWLPAGRDHAPRHRRGGAGHDPWQSVTSYIFIGL